MAQGDVVAKLIGTRWQSFALQSKGANPLKFNLKMAIVMISIW